MAGTYLVIALAGCGRIAFDELQDSGNRDAVGDGRGDVPVGPTITLICNNRTLTVGITDPTSAHLSAFGGASRLGAVWTTNGGKPASATGIIGPPETLSGGTYDDGATFAETVDLVAASAGNGQVAFAGRQGTSSLVHVYDEASLSEVTTNPSNTPVAIGTPRALAPTGATTGAIFALAGLNGTQAQVVGVTAANTIVGSVNTGTNVVDLSLARVGNRIALADSTAASTCELRTLASDLSSAGSGQTWGAGACDHPIIASVPGRTDMLVVNHSPGDVLQYQLVGTAGTNVALGSLMTLATTATDARVTATSAGYWVIYRQQATTLWAQYIDLGGTLGTLFTMTISFEPTAHDVASIGNSSYAVFFSGGGLYVEPLCP